MLKRVFFILLLITAGCAKHSDIATGAGLAIIGCTDVTDRPKVYNCSKVSVVALFDPKLPDPAYSTMICVDPITRLYLQKPPTEKQ